MKNVGSSKLSITRPNYGRTKLGTSTGKTLTFLLLAFTMTTTLSQAQTHTVLHSFDWTDGADPNAGLVQGINGNFYGATTYGGAAGNCLYSCAPVRSLKSRSQKAVSQYAHRRFDQSSSVDSVLGPPAGHKGIGHPCNPSWRSISAQFQ